jgi:ParB/RepB/Spo0J family partition protein
VSILEHGLLHPLVVTEHGRHADRFIVLDGHRRLAAALKAGQTAVPSVIRHRVSDSDQIALMLVADYHRRDLDPIERAEAFAALRNQGLTQAEIGKRVGIGHSAVAKYLTLLDLDEDERTEVRSGRIAGHLAIQTVRERRQERRAEAGRSPMGRPTGPTAYFSASHPLADAVKERCTHFTRQRVGNVGCGPCWEVSIREDAASETPVGLVALPDEYDVDEVAVERVLGGDGKARLNPAERAEVVRRWQDQGRSLNELERLTGWNVWRYLPADPEGKAS